MKVIMVMFDSLNRRMLEPYGCDWVHTPNFTRLAGKSVCFSNSYVGSMPCMPSRREIHTGRYNFLHRSWGPIEPYDVSMPEILKTNGIVSHLVSDHYHYWEDGGCTYHSRYSSWRASRGQEGDPWRCKLKEPSIPHPNPGQTRKSTGLYDMIHQDWINRDYMQEESEFPQAKTFAMGLEFLEENHDCDNWFLQIETFDPHEPFHVPQKYLDLYPYEYGGIPTDWPEYRRAEANEQKKADMLRCRSAALHTMCDEYLGRVLDVMDRYDMWSDTMLIVNTDHGFLLGEHGWWAKCVMPFYNEVAHTPLFIWDPRSGICREQRHSLVQTIDLPATILDFFSIERSPAMEGIPLRETVADDTPVRDAGLFGLFGAHVNITDGRYVYMAAPVNPDNTPLYEYILMPTQHGARRAFFEPERLAEAKLSAPFPFTLGCPLLKVPGKRNSRAHQFGTLLFDLEQDPYQEHPIHDEVIEAQMKRRMVELMQQNDAPLEQYERLGLNKFLAVAKSHENQGDGFPDNREMN